MMDFGDEELMAQLESAKEAHPAVASLLAAAIAEIQRLDSMALGYADALQYDD